MKQHRESHVAELEARVTLAENELEATMRRESDQARKLAESEARLVTLEAERDKWTTARNAAYEEMAAQLAYWQTCANCGEHLKGPGICDKAISENEKGLEEMFDQALSRAETVEAERDALRQALKDRTEQTGETT